MAKSKMSADTVAKLKHVLKMNRDSMTTTGVVYVEQAIKEVEDLLRLLDAAEAIEQAEMQGFSKFTTEDGVKMVVCTQNELDAVIAQAKRNKKI